MKKSVLITKITIWSSLNVNCFPDNFLPDRAMLCWGRRVRNWNYVVWNMSSCYLSSISEILDSGPTAAVNRTVSTKRILVLLDTATTGGKNAVQAINNCSLKKHPLQDHHSWHEYLFPKVWQTHVWYLLFPPQTVRVCCLLEPAPSALALGSCMSAHASGRSSPPTVCAYQQQTCLWQKDSWTGWVRVWAHRNDSLLWKDAQCKSAKGTKEENPILISCTDSKYLSHSESQLRKLSYEIIHVK